MPCPHDSYESSFVQAKLTLCALPEEDHGKVLDADVKDNERLMRQVELYKEELRLQKEANLMQHDNKAWANRWSWMERSVHSKVALTMEEQLAMTVIKLEGLSHRLSNRMQRKILPVIFWVWRSRSSCSAGWPRKTIAAELAESKLMHRRLIAAVQQWKSLLDHKVRQQLQSTHDRVERQLKLEREQWLSELQAAREDAEMRTTALAQAAEDYERSTIAKAAEWAAERAIEQEQIERQLQHELELARENKAQLAELQAACAELTDKQTQSTALAKDLEVLRAQLSESEKLVEQQQEQLVQKEGVAAQQLGYLKETSQELTAWKAEAETNKAALAQAAERAAVQDQIQRQLQQELDSVQHELENAHTKDAHVTMTLQVIREEMEAHEAVRAHAAEQQYAIQKELQHELKEVWANEAQLQLAHKRIQILLYANEIRQFELEREQWESELQAACTEVQMGETALAEAAKRGKKRTAKAEALQAHLALSEKLAEQQQQELTAQKQAAELQEEALAACRAEAKRYQAELTQAAENTTEQDKIQMQLRQELDGAWANT